ncbi:alpha/beta hydrolase [Allokutzneria sp. NRRL B-24872]|uniref:alpha/beta hydrolase n=1 Tax=Allokutzneria sp. NRRL B-24872 TaxID=1137961 RepID=UPI000A35EBD6|nr:alpha/beta hydrolase [Allokutzneria sp. NRRL B-24872]
MRRTGAALLALGAALTLMPASASASATAAPALDWKPCFDGAATQCATLTVPLDWATGKGTVRLAVWRSPARKPEQRIGALMYNPGGPGSGTAQTVATGPEGYFPTQLLDRFDLVGIDFRGTGASSPVHCGLTAHDPAVNRFPTTASDVAKLARANAAFADSCAAQTGPVLAHLDTATIARDIDALREALGEKQISYLGISYGTMLGQAYAELFPHRLRALALDSVVDRSLSTTQMLRDNAKATQDGWEYFVEWCARTTSCALHGKDVQQVLREVTARAERGELKAGERTVTAGELRANITATMNFESALPDLARNLLAASTGDGTGVSVGMFSLPTYPAYRSIICQDVPARFDVPSAVRESRALNPELGGYSEFWDIASGCVGWTQPVRWTPHPWRAKGLPPTLLVSGAHDVATPRAWAESVQRQLPGSHLLTWDGFGHAAWPGNNKCGLQAVRDYLLTLTMPTGQC